MLQNRVIRPFEIHHAIIQGGMYWAERAADQSRPMGAGLADDLSGCIGAIVRHARERLTGPLDE